eukprot:TRINITY_DN979_c0_g1_i1.p1 TRINITY_DN979_c0_g1~~TRINITY_DN979_c0_g1_i1.p1  ORF type:complete len:552 (-),score=169.60 TRINITY_DN979_c0_g1_i1:24-1679(-)
MSYRLPNTRFNDDSSDDDYNDPPPEYYDPEFDSKPNTTFNNSNSINNSYSPSSSNNTITNQMINTTSFKWDMNEIQSTQKNILQQHSLIDTINAQKEEIEMLKGRMLNPNDNTNESQVIKNLTKRNKALSVELGKERRINAELKHQVNELLAVVQSHTNIENENESPNMKQDTGKLKKDMDTMLQRQGQHTVIIDKLKLEIKKMRKILSVEIGNNVDLDKYLEDPEGFKGRAEKISLLKRKVKELELRVGDRSDEDNAMINIKKQEKNHALQIAELLEKEQQYKEILKNQKNTLNAVEARNTVMEREINELKKKLKVVAKKTRNDSVYIDKLRSYLKQNDIIFDVTAEQIDSKEFIKRIKELEKLNDQLRSKNKVYVESNNINDHNVQMYLNNLENEIDFLTSTKSELITNNFILTHENQSLIKRLQKFEHLNNKYSNEIQYLENILKEKNIDVTPIQSTLQRKEIMRFEMTIKKLENDFNELQEEFEKNMMQNDQQILSQRETLKKLVGGDISDLSQKNIILQDENIQLKNRIKELKGKYNTLAIKLQNS